MIGHTEGFCGDHKGVVETAVKTDNAGVMQSVKVEKDLNAILARITC
jgi:hypothetical protein